MNNIKTTSDNEPVYPTNNWYVNWGKRLVDLTLVLPLVIFGAPIFVVLAALVRYDLGSPILFTQRRIGRGGREFIIYKVRTMTNERDASGQLLPDDKRLTRLGRLIRKTSMDELPQIWNVLKGEMSFIGPRALLPQYIPYYTARESSRHNVTPGITGYAQVRGRNAVTWDSRLENDAYYVENLTPALDWQIFLDTFRAVFKAEGVESGGPSVTMPFLNEERASWLSETPKAVGM
jgi:lipopolysaccharide/colanic/teichoic acid biosynthesis glycosyltransferase